ncbi:porin [Flavobacterium franklandianum]|uniref:Porin n=2 Tax=Flavobacterium TaxID=237 RepID=A0A432CCY4_9FLAO|nr:MULTISPECIES: porin [Flavobacterium]RTY98736.1 porin [Flavobacterium bomense]TRX16081.1 porin [Flavobacterium franklandianum]TRX23388.1 porin [Flavobacterium franklandianum]
MKKVTLILALMITSITFAQDATETPTSTPLEISGSGDLYYKYDFSKNANIGTSFASDQNSLSLGMLDFALKKSYGKASFVGELSFGPRGAGQSIPDVAGQSFHIQNLYTTYAFTDKFSMTAGYMGTFIGYEVISPVANFHYSTSYLFTNGPFQNAGIKANYKISDKFGAMLGIFNDTWNNYQADPTKGLNAVGGQLSYASEGVSAYLNFMDGSVSGTIIDLTATFQLSEKFKLGLNVADWSNEGEVGYTGFALYPSVAVTDAFALGLRAEYFKSKEGADLYGIDADQSVTAFTLSANYKVGGFTFIPEFRLDSNSDEYFTDSDMAATKAASQATLAVVYGF